MKKLLLLALLAFPFLAKAQLAQSPEYAWRVQICDLAYNTQGQLTACPVTVFYQSTISNNGAVVSNVQSSPQTLSVDLVAQAATTVNYNGTSYTYGQVFALMNAIFVQERATQFANAAKAAAAAQAAQAAQAAAAAAATTNNATSGVITTNNSIPAVGSPVSTTNNAH